MALIVGVNSYLSLVSAESYFIKRIDIAGWNTATEIDKEKALSTASLQFNNLDWLGTIVDINQDLAFPRNGSYFDSMAGGYITLDPLVVPNRILVAICEQAYYLINNDGLLDSDGTPTEIKVGPILLKGLASTVKPKLSPIAKSYYAPLLSNLMARGSWHRAN